MSPDELKLLLNVHSEGYVRALETMMKEWRDKFDNVELKMINMQKSHDKEMNELKRSLEFSQKDVADLKQEIKQLKRK